MSGGTETAFREKLLPCRLNFLIRSEDMLNENQLKLLRHLARFNLLDYPSCLDMLNNDGGSDRTALSYAFRPLTKNRYVSKDKRGCCVYSDKGAGAVS